MKIFIYALLATLVMLMATSAIAAQFRVADVIDGDTIIVEPPEGGDRIRVRIYGVDAPEGRQPGGEAARRFVLETALYQLVDIKEIDRDRYGRTVAIVDTPSGNLESLLLSAGMAWVYPRYCKIPQCIDWERQMKYAMLNKKGLWIDRSSVEPWVWRKLQKQRNLD